MKKALITLSIISLCILISIEFYNAKSGFLLPRTVNTEMNNPKWRVLGSPKTQYERMYRGINNIPLDIQLTQNQQREVNTEIRRRESEITLRDIVGSWGLIQYPLSCIIIVLSLFLYLVNDRKTKLYLYTMGVGFIAMSTAILRAYFTSLGW